MRKLKQPYSARYRVILFKLGVNHKNFILTLHQSCVDMFCDYIVNFSKKLSLIVKIHKPLTLHLAAGDCLYNMQRAKRVGCSRGLGVQSQWGPGQSPWRGPREIFLKMECS